MATDYDAPRTVDVADVAEHAIESLKQNQATSKAGLGDDSDAVELGLDLPDADLSGEDLTIRILPRQADEFTCSSCFLVHHRSQLGNGDGTLCLDCAA